MSDQIAERTLRFAEVAATLQNRKALGDALTPVLEVLGARHYACLYLNRETGGYGIGKALANVPRHFQEFYLQRGYDADDPIFQGALLAGACGYWDEQTGGRQLSSAGQRVMDFASEFDMIDGFTKRVMLDRGGAAVMMACGRQLVRSDRARAAFRIAFHVFANEGARLLKLGSEAVTELRVNAPNLSKTQLKVLRMRSEGLTNRDIAQAMSRTEKTIECHVTEILRRLGARNMIDAIRIASHQNALV